MSLALALKVLVLAILFVASGGALASDWGRRHMLLVVLASVVAVGGTFFLFKDIYEDLKQVSEEAARQQVQALQQSEGGAASDSASTPGKGDDTAIAGPPDSQTDAVGSTPAGAAVSPASAQEGLRLCNMTPGRVGIALGYKESEGWISEGWWNVAGKDCMQLLKGELAARYYYIHAIDYDNGGTWAGESTMCIDEEEFIIRGPQRCESRGYTPAKFFEVDTKKAKEWTIRLTDAQDTMAQTR